MLIFSVVKNVYYSKHGVCRSQRLRYLLLLDAAARAAEIVFGSRLMGRKILLVFRVLAAV